MEYPCFGNAPTWNILVLVTRAVDKASHSYPVIILELYVHLPLPLLVPVESAIFTALDPIVTGSSVC